MPVYMMDYGEWDPATESYPNKHLAVSWEGCVIETRERNGYHDSDFYAVVWDDEVGCIREIEYATTRFPTYDNSAVVDLTPENKAKLDKYSRAEVLRRLTMHNERQAREVVKDKVVRVVRGRKVPLGTTGRVFWMGAGFRRGYPPRVGIALSEELDEHGRLKSVAFTSSSNCEVVDPEQYMTPVKELRKYVRQLKDPYSSMRSLHPPAPGWIQI